MKGSITDELRKWAKGLVDRSTQLTSLPPKHLLANAMLEDVLSIANRIDREHKAAIDKAHADGERNGLQQARSASEGRRVRPKAATQGGGLMSRKSLLDDAIAKAKEAEDWQLVEWLRMARGGESAARWYSDKLREAHRAERKLLDENAKLRKELAKARDPQRIGGQADPSSFAYAIEQLREFRWQHATNDDDAIPYINNVADAHERENAGLWEQLKVHEGAYDVLTVSIREKRQRINDLEDQLARHGLPIGGQAENAKLRELVRDLVVTVRGCGQDGDGYGQLPCEEVCPHWGNDGECVSLHRDQCWYEEQAREMGVEVDA